MSRYVLRDFDMTDEVVINPETTPVRQIKKFFDRVLGCPGAHAERMAWRVVDAITAPDPDMRVLAALRKKYQAAVVAAPSRMWFRYDPRYWRAYRVRTGRSPWRAVQAGDRWIAQRRYGKCIAYERALIRRLSQPQ